MGYFPEALVYTVAMPVSPDIVARLKAKGFRMTAARKALIEAFGSQCNPLDVRSLHAALKRQGIAANITTVYREVQFLVDEEVLRPVQFQDGVQRFEPAHAGHHHHLVCLTCGKVTEVTMENDLASLETKIGKETGFSIEHHSLEFYGRCKKCRKA